jgi:hypothetical protein
LLTSCLVIENNLTMGRGGKAGPAKGAQKRKVSPMATSDSPKKDSGTESPPGFNMDSDSPISSVQTSHKKSRQRISDLVNILPENHIIAFKTQTEPTTRGWNAEGDSEDGDPDTWFMTQSIFEPESVELLS